MFFDKRIHVADDLFGLVRLHMCVYACVWECRCVCICVYVYMCIIYIRILYTPLRSLAPTILNFEYNIITHLRVYACVRVCVYMCIIYIYVYYIRKSKWKLCRGWPVLSLAPTYTYM